MSSHRCLWPALLPSKGLTAFPRPTEAAPAAPARRAVELGNWRLLTGHCWGKCCSRVLSSPVGRTADRAPARAAAGGEAAGAGCEARHMARAPPPRAPPPAARAGARWGWPALYPSGSAPGGHPRLPPSSGGGWGGAPRFGDVRRLRRRAGLPSPRQPRSKAAGPPVAASPDA